MIKSIALFFIAVLFFGDLNSQTHTQKYWHYRDRFFSGFTIMGDDLCYSNVCAIRNSESIENDIKSFIMLVSTVYLWAGT
jgi:hypothetical protein